MRWMMGVLALWAVVAAPALAQPANVCAAMIGEIESAQRNLAWANVDAIGEDSAVRLSVDLAKKQGEYARIQANISLLEANHCPAYQHPISETRYAASAMACRVAALRERRDDTSECDKANWKASD